MRRIVVLLAALASPAFADEPVAVRGETIIIRGHAPGWKPAAPIKDPRIAPKYSDAAILRDAWTRAWLYLDIDERGVVQRVKFLNRPGYDLEKIALDRVFGTRFTPARNGRGRAEASTLVFPIEWPSYWWIVAHAGIVTRIPISAGSVPCRGTGPLNLDHAHPVYRDCTPPDLAKIPTEPWIARPR
jgi:hypothetical protein